MARRRKNDPFLGFIIVIAIVFAVLAWFKENVIDKITPDMWGLIVVILLFSIAFRIWQKFKQRQEREAEARRLAAEAEQLLQRSRQQHAEYMAWGVERAVLIAKHQKWVSPHRLKTQVHVTDKQAAEFLQFGEMAGLLRQEVNGRYYVTLKGQEIQTKAIGGPSSSSL